MSSIHFIGGEKGGIGKSVISRLISQYCINNNYQYAGMDADQSHSTLARFYPEFTQSINLDEYESADTIIETAIESNVNVIVDLPAQSERFLNRWMDDNDVDELMEEYDINCVYWYVVDDGIDSASLAAKFLKRYTGRLPCILIKNYGRGKDFSALDESLQSALVSAAVKPTTIVEIPELHSNTMHKVDKFNLNFWAAINRKDLGDSGLSLMERRRVKVWLRKSFEQLGGVISSYVTRR